jgi:hypothetical protein
MSDDKAKTDWLAGIGVPQTMLDTLSNVADTGSNLVNTAENTIGNAAGNLVADASSAYQTASGYANSASSAISDEESSLKKQASDAWNGAGQAVDQQKQALSDGAQQLLSRAGVIVNDAGTCTQPYLKLADAIGTCVDALGGSPSELKPQILAAAKSHNLASIPSILLSSKGSQTLQQVSTAIPPLTQCLNSSDAAGNKNQIASLNKMKQDIDAITKFLQTASGAQPATASSDVSAEVSAGGAGGGAASALGPMQPDCKVKRGMVPGPKHHVYCSTHQHVLDEQAKMVIAVSLDDYKKRYGHAAAAAGRQPAAPAANQSADPPLNMTRPREPMQPDCVIVHGKVPGPKNHVMCKTHGHILDSTAKTIVAANLAEYRQMFG